MRLRVVALVLSLSPLVAAPACSGSDTPALPAEAGAPEGAPAGDGSAVTCSPVRPDPLASRRAACAFAAGARVAQTLGFTEAERRALPVKHVIVVMQENRSFDHYFGRLPQAGKADIEGWPADFTNPDTSGVQVPPSHLPTPCLPADPPHQGAAMLAGYNDGKMDGFVRTAAVRGSNGHYVMGYYDETDLPFYYFLAKTFATADRYFGSVLGGTWANRDYLYAGTSDGVTDTGQKILSAPTVFDALDTARVSWGVYSNGTPRQDCLGWSASHRGVFKFPAFLAALGDGSLPRVSFVDPNVGQDEHPANDVHDGERWTRSIYEAARASPLWKELALFFTYDESGGLADHVPPPPACLASPDQTRFDRYGMRVPVVLISPWSRRGYVSHVVHDHTSVLRFIELLFDLPALTGRDANADAMLDLFDLGCARDAPEAPPAGTGSCE